MSRIKDVAPQARTATVLARTIAAVAAQEHSHVDFVLLAFDFGEELTDVAPEIFEFVFAEFADGHVDPYMLVVELAEFSKPAARKCNDSCFGPAS